MEHNILLASGDRAETERLRGVLEGRGYRVTCVEDGHQGLSHVQVGDPDVIIADAAMAKLDGYAFCRAVRSSSRTQGIPFILLSEHRNALEVIRALERGVDCLIVKPLHDDELLKQVDRIAAHLEHRRQGGFDVQVSLKVGPRELIFSPAKQQIVEMMFATVEDLFRWNSLLQESQQALAEQARALEAKYESRDLDFRNLFHGVPIGLYQTTPDGVFLAANPALVKMLGYPDRGALLAIHVTDVYADPADRVTLLDRLELETVVWDYDVRFRRYDGSLIWVRTSVRAVRGDDGLISRYEGAVQEITDRHGMEERLRRSEEAFRLMFTNNPIPMWVFDRHTLEFLEVNEAAERHYGYTRAEFLTMGIGDIRSAEEEPRLRATLAKLQTVGSAGEWKHRRKDGRIIDVRVLWHAFEFSGRSAVVAVSEDITERKQAEEALQHSERYFRSLIEHSLDIITIVDREGIIRYESPSVARVLDYQPAELVGRDAFELVHPDDVERVRQTFAEGASTPGTVASIRFRFRAKDGTWRHLEAVGRNLLDDPTVRGIVVNSRDITERVRGNEELQRQREALHQTEKLAAMGSLLAGVAHELNNPLAVILGQVALLRQTTSDPTIEVRARRLDQAAERCGRIIKNFLALARRQPVARQRVDLNGIVSDALELVSYGLRVDNVDVRLNLAPDLPKLWADGSQLTQVFVNLITNAHHAVRDGSGSARGIEIDTAYDAAGQRVRLAVADTGPGIPAEILPRMFEPFFTTKPPGVGTGLGLSLCDSIVAGHGGTIEATNRPEGGARLTVNLPLGQSASVVEGPAGASPPERVRARRLLIVDDERDVAETLAELVAEDAEKVDVALDATAALAMLRDAPYDVILVDMKMPKLDGAGFYAELARQHPALARRVIFLTGDGLSSATAAFLAAVSPPFLEKPLKPSEVREMVQGLLRQTAEPLLTT
jgi:PAS domain S-box-containing protein